MSNGEDARCQNQPIPDFCERRIKSIKQILRLRPEGDVASGLDTGFLVADAYPTLFNGGFQKTARHCGVGLIDAKAKRDIGVAALLHRDVVETHGGIDCVDYIRAGPIA